MKVPIFKQRLVQTLWQNVDSNFELYTAEDFNSLFKRPEFSVNIREMETLKLREEDLVNLVPEPKNDGRNAFVIYKALEGMTPNKAQDERIWTALTHTVGFEFSKKRWLSENYNKEKNIKRIKSHFFGRVDGNRGLHRNNALASLW